VAIASGVVTAALGGFAALSAKNANALAGEARGVADSADLALYQDLVEQANAAAGKGNIGLYSAIATTGITAGFTWMARSRAGEESAARSALDAAKATPYAVGGAPEAAEPAEEESQEPEPAEEEPPATTD
jgi:hypothetical protein